MPVPVTSLGAPRSHANEGGCEGRRAGAERGEETANGGRSKDACAGRRGGAYAYGGFKYRSEAVPVLG